MLSESLPISHKPTKPKTFNTFVHHILTMTYTELIPFVGHHSSIVIGKGGSTIKQLMRETGCFIKAEKPNASANRPLPFFVVQGPNEKAVNQATIRIQRLLMNSMMRNEKKYKDETSELSQRNQFLELKVADIDENGRDSDEEADACTTSVGNEKDRWIEKLTRKVTEKDQEIEQLKKEVAELTNVLYDSDDDEDDGINVNMGPPVANGGKKKQVRFKKV